MWATMWNTFTHWHFKLCDSCWIHTERKTKRALCCSWLKESVNTFQYFKKIASTTNIYCSALCILIYRVQSILSLIKKKFHNPHNKKKKFRKKYFIRNRCNILVFIFSVLFSFCLVVFTAEFRSSFTMQNVIPII